MTKQEIETLNLMRSHDKSAAAIRRRMRYRSGAANVESRSCSIRAEKRNTSAPTGAGTLGGMPTRKRCSGKHTTV